MYKPIINNNGSNVKQPSQSTNLKFGNTSENGCIYKGHLEGLLIYSNLFTYKFWKYDRQLKRKVLEVEVLTPQQTLLLIRLFDDWNWDTALSTVSLEDLALACRSSQTHTSLLLNNMLLGEFICPFCSETSDIIKRGPNIYYNEKKEGWPGHTYKLEGVWNYISHLTLNHRKIDEKYFWKEVKKLAKKEFLSYTLTRLKENRVF